jgi:hypothetical protein
MLHNWKHLAALAAVLALSPRLAAQTASSDPRSLDERLHYFYEFRSNALERSRPGAGDGRSQSERDAQLAERLANLPDVLGTNLLAFSYYALPRPALTDSFKEFLQSADKARVDQQIGSASKAVKTGVATLFSFALESGAVTQTIDQNVATLRTNAEGLARFLSNQDVFATCASDDQRCNAWGALKNLELSASFTVSDADTKTLTGSTTGAAVRQVDFGTLLSQHQFASATARYAVENSRDLRSKKYQEKWLAWFERNRDSLQTAGEDLLNHVKDVTIKVQQTDDLGRPTTAAANQYSLWLMRTQAALGQTLTEPQPEDKWKRAMQLQLDELLDRMRKVDPDFDTKLNELAKAYVRYLAIRRDLMSTLVTDPALTVEYTYAEPQLQPKLHTVKIAYAYSPKGVPGAPNPGTITVNLGLDYYHAAQPTAKPLETSHWKDAQFALQFDRPLGPAGAATTLSAAFYYQYQMNPNSFTIPASATALPGTNIPIPAAGTTLLSEAGSIFAAQATLTIRMASSGLKVPLGISWANRTELVPGNRVIGHIGFTFDSSPLLLMQSLK